MIRFQPKQKAVRPAHLGLNLSTGMRFHTPSLWASPRGHRPAYRLILLALFIACSLTGSAQVDTGSIVGQVTDSTGAVIPNVEITLSNQNTNLTQTTKTDNAGEYTFSLVRIGTYTISAQIQGFRTAQRSDVRVQIQQQLSIPFVLSAGSVHETVVVSAGAPLLQTQNASVGQVINQQQINQLPLNGRNYLFLAQLAPGVTTGQQGSRGEDLNGRFVANGVRATQNDFLLDGIDNNSSIVSVQNGKDFVIMPSIDALAEFKIQTNDYDAEFGRSAGAVINATVKSGTNRLHGDIWEFLRNDALDANDYFANQARLPRAPFRRNQFGGTIGGPVYLPHLYNGRNHTFFFADYEGTRIDQGSTLTGTVPTVLERQSGYTNFSDLISLQHGNNPADAAGNVYPIGTILDPSTTEKYGSSYIRQQFPNNQIPANRIDPNAIALLNLLPLPTNNLLENNYTTNVQDVDTINNWDARVDEAIDQKNYLFVRYSYNAHTQNHPGIFTDYQQGYADGGNSSSQSDFFDRAQNVAVGWTHTYSGSRVNDLRLGLNREHVLWLQPNGNTLNIPQKFGILGVPQFADNGGLPQFGVGDISRFGSFNYLPSNKFGTTPQINDDYTWVLGGHTLKLGAEAQRILFPYRQPPQSRGYFNFSGLYTSVYGQTDASTGIAQMLLTPTATSNLAGANQVALSNFVENSLTHKYIGAYVQDDWRVTPKLTLDLGMRYDFFDFAHEQHGYIANFVPGPNYDGGTYLVTPQINSTLPADFVSALSGEGITVQEVNQNALVNVQHLNFSPRIGFAESVTDHLVLRGGYGIFYGGIEDTGGSGLLTLNFPIGYNLTYSAVNGATPLAANNSLGLLETSFENISLVPSAVNPSAVSLISDQKHWTPTYVEGYNLSLQYLINRQLALTAAYVGDVGRHIETTFNENTPATLLPPTVTTTPYLPYAKTALSGDGLTLAEGASDFNAGQITLEERPDHGLTFLADFALQKTITDARDPLEPDIGGYRNPVLPNFGIGADEARADFDVHRIFHLSGTYDFPFGKEHAYGATAKGVQQAFLGGWSVNFITTVEDGMPFTISCAPATSAGSGCNANLVAGENPYAHSSAEHFINIAAFANPPAVTTIGQTDYAPLGSKGSQVTGPPYRTLDLSFFKKFVITQRISSEFRAEFFNITNTPNFALPSSTNLQNAINFGQITATTDNPNDPRETQFALKIYY